MIDKTRTHAFGRRRRSASRWALIAACLAVLSTAAIASHNDSGPRGGRGHGTDRVTAVQRHGAVWRNPAQRQFRRGHAAGRQAGWSAGYYDGLYGRGFSCSPPGKIGRRSSRYRAGFARGYAQAYADGYRRGVRKRRNHCVWYGW